MAAMQSCRTTHRWLSREKRRLCKCPHRLKWPRISSTATQRVATAIGYSDMLGTSDAGLRLAAQLNAPLSTALIALQSTHHLVHIRRHRRLSKPWIYAKSESWCLSLDRLLAIAARQIRLSALCSRVANITARHGRGVLLQTISKIAPRINWAGVGFKTAVASAIPLRRIVWRLMACASHGYCYWLGDIC